MTQHLCLSIGWTVQAAWVRISVALCNDDSSPKRRLHWNVQLYIDRHFDFQITAFYNDC